jgi:hypothetical protein
MTTDSKQREQQAYAALRRLTAPGLPGASTTPWVPAWSSRQLEQALDSILSTADSSVGDVLRALWDLSGQPDVQLTKPMAQFIHDIVVWCFTRYRARFDQEDFEWMARELSRRPTPAQGYVALLSLPEGRVAACRDAILASLEGSEFFEAARKMLE